MQGFYTPFLRNKVPDGSTNNTRVNELGIRFVLGVCRLRLSIE